MKKTLFAIVGTLLLLTACNGNTPSAISVRGKIYKHPTAVQYLKFKADSVLYYGDFGNEALSNHTFAYTQKDEVITVYTPTPEHLLAYEGFVLRGDTIYELFADASDPSYQDHQPQDPKAFSLVGKRYVYESAVVSGFMDTLEFLTADSVWWHPYPKVPFRDYTLNYPQLIISPATDPDDFTFTDTATLVCEGLERTYYLVH